MAKAPSTRPRVDTAKCPQCAGVAYRIPRLASHKLLLGSKRFRCDECNLICLKWMGMTLDGATKGGAKRMPPASKPSPGVDSPSAAALVAAKAESVVKLDRVAAGSPPAAFPFEIPELVYKPFPGVPAEVAPMGILESAPAALPGGLTDATNKDRPPVLPLSSPVTARRTITAAAPETIPAVAHNANLAVVPEATRATVPEAAVATVPSATPAVASEPTPAGTTETITDAMQGSLPLSAPITETIPGANKTENTALDGSVTTTETPALIPAPIAAISTSDAEVKQPQFKWPQIAWPVIKRPAIRLPKIRLPQFNFPKPKWPGIRWPNIHLPRFSMHWPDFSQMKIRINWAGMIRINDASLSPEARERAKTLRMYVATGVGVLAVIAALYLLWFVLLPHLLSGDRSIRFS